MHGPFGLGVASGVNPRIPHPQIGESEGFFQSMNTTKSLYSSKFNISESFQRQVLITSLFIPVAYQALRNFKPFSATRLSRQFGLVPAQAQADSSSQKLGTLHRQLAKPSEVPGGAPVDRDVFGERAIMAKLTWTRLVPYQTDSEFPTTPFPRQYPHTITTGRIATPHTDAQSRPLAALADLSWDFVTIV